MRKKILFGSLLAVILLLLMPTIPAIQLKTIDNAAQNDIIQKLNDINFKEMNYIFNTRQMPRHPILFLIVWLITSFRYLRAGIFYEKSIDWCSPQCRWLHPHDPIIHPFLFLRSVMIFITTLLWADFWYYLSSALGWNWHIL